MKDKDEELGFRLKKRQSRRVGPKCIMDLDFADDISLLSEEIKQAQKLLLRVERAAAEVGLMANSNKNKVMAFSQSEQVDIRTIDGSKLEVVDNFNYLGSLVGSTAADVKRRIALAWTACNSLRKIWNSSLSRKFKGNLFQTTVESVLLYGCEAWTLTKSLMERIDGCFTRLLRSALDVSWESRARNEDLYGELPKVTFKIQERRLKLAGHCYRHPEEIASNLVLWSPTRGRRSRGRPALTYVR